LLPKFVSTTPTSGQPPSYSHPSKQVSQGKFAMAVYREVIAQLDLAQESRALSP
jgi:hypothetical protein